MFHYYAQSRLITIRYDTPNISERCLSTSHIGTELTKGSLTDCIEVRQ